MGVVLLLLLGQGKSLFHKMGNVIRVQMWVDESIFKMRTFSCGCLFYFLWYLGLSNNCKHSIAIIKASGRSKNPGGGSNNDMVGII